MGFVNVFVARMRAYLGWRPRGEGQRVAHAEVCRLRERLADVDLVGDGRVREPPRDEAWAIYGVVHGPVDRRTHREVLQWDVGRVERVDAKERERCDAGRTLERGELLRARLPEGELDVGRPAVRVETPQRGVATAAPATVDNTAAPTIPTRTAATTVPGHRRRMSLHATNAIDRTRSASSTPTHGSAPGTRHLASPAPGDARLMRPTGHGRSAARDRAADPCLRRLRPLPRRHGARRARGCGPREVRNGLSFVPSGGVAVLLAGIMRFGLHAPTGVTIRGDARWSRDSRTS